MDFGGSGRVSYGVPGCTGTIKEAISLPVPSWPERARCRCRLAGWGWNWEGMFCVLVVNLRARGAKKGNGQCWRQRGQPDSQSPCPSLGKSGLRGRRGKSFLLSPLLVCALLLSNRAGCVSVEAEQGRIAGARCLTVSQPRGQAC